MNDQFLVEVADTTAEQLAEKGLSEAAGLLELNRLFTAWVETGYHCHVHSETGQTPLQRWAAGWDLVGRPPALPTTGALTEAFLWSQLRTVTKTGTVSLHGNTYQVEPALAARKVELVFSPFNLEDIQVRYRDRTYGTAVPHIITRHTHPKARPETRDTAPPPVTGIDYLAMVADTHHRLVADDERIGFHALYPTHPGQLPGQLSIDDLLESTDGGSADQGDARQVSA